MDPKLGALRFGRFGEWLALIWLLARGYRLRDRNWHGGGGELDLVMEDGEEIVFIEVRSRSRSGSAVASVDHGKRRRLERAASSYLSRHRLWSRPCRFDIVAIERPKRLWPRLLHHRDAFRPPDRGRL